VPESVADAGFRCGAGPFHRPSGVIGAEFVAIQIAEIGKIEFRSAQTGRALIFAAQFQSLCMKGVYFGRTVAIKSDHRAIADGRGFLVVRTEYGKGELAIFSINLSAARMRKQ